MFMVIDGKVIAAQILERLKKTNKIKKFLAGVLVGKDAASKSFLEQKKRAAEEAEIDFRLYEFPENISNDNLRKEVGRIAAQKSCGGIVVQLPLPGQINSQYVLNAIPAEKDIDVLGERTLGAFYAGRGDILPPSVSVVLEILNKFPIDLKNSVFAVVGAGRLIGKPVAAWALGKVKELMVLDIGSDLTELKKADIVILGAGKPGLIKSEVLKDGAGVIDFGYSKNSEGKIFSDLNISGGLENLLFYTPTPGGTGPILVAKLLENFYTLNK